MEVRGFINERLIYLYNREIDYSSQVTDETFNECATHVLKNAGSAGGSHVCGQLITDGIVLLKKEWTDGLLLEDEAKWQKIAMVEPTVKGKVLPGGGLPPYVL